MISSTLAFIISEFVILSCICLILLRYFKSNLVPVDVTVAVYISWVLGFIGILLLPYDISIALTQNNKNSDILTIIWQVIYWSTFLLAWLWLPIQLEYHNSGDFSIVGKLKQSIWKNLLFYFIITLIGVIYVIIMITSRSVSLPQVIGFMMAMGNTYGVLLITVLMGNGLIGLPKRLWQMADSESELIRLYLSASNIESLFQDARYDLEDCEIEVKFAEETLLKAPVGSYDKSLLLYISKLSKSVTEFQFSNRSLTNMNRKNREVSNEEKEKYLTKDGLISLNSRLIQTQTQAQACDCRWKNLILQCQKYENLVTFHQLSSQDIHWFETMTDIISYSNIIKNNKNYNKKSKNRCKDYFINKYNNIATFLYNLWIYRLYSISCRILSIVCFLTSILILYSELVLVANTKSPIGLIIEQNFSSPLYVQVIACISLLYMSICTYWSLFRVNLGYAYSLQGPNQTTSASLICNGEYFSRLQFTLGYNFLLILNINRTSNTSFNKLFSNMKLIPVFGSSFIKYVPVIMIAVALITLFNGYARLWRIFGVETEETTSNSICPFSKIVLDDEEKEQYNNGKAIIASELRRLRSIQEDMNKSNINTSDSIELVKFNRNDNKFLKEDDMDTYTFENDNSFEKLSTDSAHSDSQLLPFSSNKSMWNTLSNIVKPKSSVLNKNEGYNITSTSSRYKDDLLEYEDNKITINKIINSSDFNGLNENSQVYSGRYSNV